MPIGYPGSNPPREFVCEYCGSMFERKVVPSSPCQYKFCSPACRNKARILKDVPCPICGTMFKPNINDTGRVRKRHCSAKCGSASLIGRPSPKRTPKHIRAKVASRYPTEGAKQLAKELDMSEDTIRSIAYKEGVKLYKEPRSNIFTCKRCGKEFEKQHYPSRATPKYCSPECHKNRITVNCAVCDRPFTTHKCREGIHRYCSAECGREGKKRPKQICGWCDKKYRPSKTGNNFCSLQCAANNRKATRLHKACEMCGKEFVVRKGYTHARFCSMHCSAKGVAKRGPDNPNWLGGHSSYRGPNWADQSSRARERDNYTCQMCGLKQESPALPVHHIIPYRMFNGDYETANVLSNLATLCPRCHTIADSRNRQRNDSGQFNPIKDPSA